MNEPATEAPMNDAEHNPDNLSPEQYGAPEWRLLRVGESIIDGDELWHDNEWKLTQLGGRFTVKEVYEAYRRRVSPTITQVETLTRERDEARAEVNSWTPLMLHLVSLPAFHDSKREGDNPNRVRLFIDTLRAQLAASESALNAAREALKITREVMLNHAGWNLNFDKDGKELPMTRPLDVQEADAKVESAIAQIDKALSPQQSKTT